MNIEDVIVNNKYRYTKSDCEVIVLKVDKETRNVYVRNFELLDGWYTQDGWTHIKNLEVIA